MKRQIVYLLTFIMIFNLAGAQVALAQTSDAKRTAKMKEKVERIGGDRKTTIVIKMLDKRIFKGKVTNISADQFSLREQNGIESTISFDEIKAVNRPGLSTPAKTVLIASAATGGVIVLVFLSALFCWGNRC